VAAWLAAPWVRYFANTFFIAGLTTLSVLVTSTLAGFAFGVLRFRGRSFLFSAVLSMMMIPLTVLLIPDYLILKDIHWLNTYWAQIVPFGASVFGIFLLRQFFLTVPQDLIDAADIDGSSQWRFIWQICVPMARPVLTTIGIYTFMASWDAFLWPYIMTSSPSVQPIEVGLARFFGGAGVSTEWTVLAAAVMFTTLPIIVLFLFFQRQFIAGASSTSAGVKG
jgi:multiple sugar transport system permease protein